MKPISVDNDSLTAACHSTGEVIEEKPLALYDLNISGGGAEGNSGRLAHLAAGQSMQLLEAPLGAAESRRGRRLIPRI